MPLKTSRIVLRRAAKGQRIPVFSVLALLVFLGGALPAMGQKKGVVYKLAETAAVAGKIEDAQRLYCQVAEMDPEYKNAKMLCAVMTQELEKESKNNEERFKLGVKSFNEGNYDAALHEFNNIRWGPRLKEAQEYLNVKIPQARKPASSKPG